MITALEMVLLRRFCQKLDDTAVNHMAYEPIFVRNPQPRSNGSTSSCVITISDI
ncbi:hypothetical protein SK128_002471 [Halocaridina rubra]|uniref:Uncharacterized protein n=1 Tax=Halocaridina rubra TaxID=373956 RepID=A0AAN8XVD2_HALRR